LEQAFTIEIGLKHLHRLAMRFVAFGVLEIIVLIHNSLKAVAEASRGYLRVALVFDVR
jgi:hypothetical protein